MVIDHAGEELCTQGCVFEDTVKLKRMDKAKNKGGFKKEEKIMPYRKHEGYSLMESKWSLQHAIGDFK